MKDERIDRAKAASRVASIQTLFLTKLLKSGSSYVFKCFALKGLRARESFYRTFLRLEMPSKLQARRQVFCQNRTLFGSINSALSNLVPMKNGSNNIKIVQSLKPRLSSPKITGGSVTVRSEFRNSSKNRFRVRIPFASYAKPTHHNITLINFFFPSF